ncbi:ATP-binding protein [Amycolatopsis acidicola]|uniref:ATP-binding protein n=1 Tax=Amycolatopsis acidicola TaxID=2596893 RepID=A0A5N0UZ40_9PSEU|nr:ATP-binding protein [Amycolatopsis acidicola]KAA9158761.1 ATP-binding protein [Amycolatopsis acidicola]
MRNVPAGGQTGSVREFHHRIAASAAGLTPVREALAVWATGHALAAERCEDLVLASYEAMANSAEHAYRGREDGLLDVLAVADDGELTVTVTDWGTWKTPDGADPFRGRGLLLIAALADDSVRASGAEGTTVTMKWRLHG